MLNNLTLSKTNLHIHTTCSDGLSAPAEMVSMLKSAGVTVFAITDHDQIEGNVEAAEMAAKLGLTHINGVEFSCRYGKGEAIIDEAWITHILGYAFDMTRMRKEMPEDKPTIQEGINIIHDCGGFAVLAHPLASRAKANEVDEKQTELLISKMASYGIDGIEVYYQKYAPAQIERLNQLADSYGLHKTIGTDYHGFDDRRAMAFDILMPSEEDIKKTVSALRERNDSHISGNVCLR